jgi:hypothetical protein
MFNEKTCTRKWWNGREPFVKKRLAVLEEIEKEVANETFDSITNEATVCEYCGCDHCGQPMLLRECSRCGSTLCGCHMLPEEHACVAVPFNQGWNEYAKWQEKVR